MAQRGVQCRRAARRSVAAPVLLCLACLACALAAARQEAAESYDLWDQLTAAYDTHPRHWNQELRDQAEAAALEADTFEDGQLEEAENAAADDCAEWEPYDEDVDLTEESLDEWETDDEDVDSLEEDEWEEVVYDPRRETWGFFKKVARAADNVGSRAKGAAQTAGRGVRNTANRAGRGIKDTANKAGGGLKTAAFTAGGALGIPGTGPDHDKVQRELEAKIRSLKMPSRPSVQKSNGFTVAAGQTGVQYQAVPAARMDKNMAIFMGNVIRGVEDKMKAAKVNMNDLRSRQDSETAFKVLDEALASNPLVKPIRRNQVTQKSIGRSSTSVFKFDRGASHAQKEAIKAALKGMVNDNEIWFSFSHNGVGDDKISLVNEAYSQTSVEIKSLASFIRGRDTFRVHVGDLAYLKFPKTLDERSHLKIYYLAIDTWVEVERTLFVSKSRAGLDFQMIVSEFAANNDALNKLNPNTRKTNVEYIKSLGFDFSSLKSSSTRPQVKTAAPVKLPSLNHRPRRRGRWRRGLV